MNSDMDTPGFVSSPYTGQTVYHSQEEDIIIDLGLSLRTSLQPESYRPQCFLNSAEYGDLVGWSQMNSNMKGWNAGRPTISEDCDDETEGVQSKERWAYVKVNMEGVIVGRKVCILDHGSYSSLELQLEDMFGRLCTSGLRLFQPDSEFSLFYKDSDENWRTVGDVPWKEFVDCVKRLKIVRKGGALHPCPSSSFS